MFATSKHILNCFAYTLKIISYFKIPNVSGNGHHYFNDIIVNAPPQKKKISGSIVH